MLAISDAHLTALATAILATLTVVLAFVAVIQMREARKSNEAVREAARAQLQPIVFAHGFAGPTKTPDGWATRYRYWLKNEGVGPALDVEHGVRVGEDELTIDDHGSRYRTLSAGESVPEGYPATSQAFSPLELIAAEHGDPIYWTRYSNIFGDRYETRNYSDASQPAEFLSLDR
jgi:hypothetical protein